MSLESFLEQLRDILDGSNHTIPYALDKLSAYPEEYDCLQLEENLRDELGFARCKACGYWMLHKELDSSLCPDCYGM